MPFPVRHRFIIIYLSVCLLIYSGLFILINNTGVYNIDKTTNNDRFFSMDDVYYVTEIYSSEIDSSLRIVKHPLFMVFGNIIARLASLVFGDLSYKSKYILIVFLQIIAQIVSLIYLYKILYECYKLKDKVAVIFLSIYALSVSGLIFTLFSESYIFSGTALIMSYYYLRKGNILASVLLGIVVTGITITNSAIWAIMALLLIEGLKKKILTLCVTVTAFILIIALTPVGLLFFNNFTYVLINSPKNYSDRYGLPALALRSLYAFFGTTAFYVDTVKQSPFGQYPGRAISFLPSSNPLILAFILLWTGLLIYSAVINRRNRLLYAPLAVLVFNLLLHGVKQYGLKEAFLYSLHHFYAQILILAAALAGKDKCTVDNTTEELLASDKGVLNRPDKLIFAIMVIFFAGEIILNLKGYWEFYGYLLSLTNRLQS